MLRKCVGARFVTPEQVVPKWRPSSAAQQRRGDVARAPAHAQPCQLRQRTRRVHGNAREEGPRPPSLPLSFPSSRNACRVPRRVPASRPWLPLRSPARPPRRARRLPTPLRRTCLGSLRRAAASYSTAPRCCAARCTARWRAPSWRTCSSAASAVRLRGCAARRDETPHATARLAARLARPRRRQPGVARRRRRPGHDAAAHRGALLARTALACAPPERMSPLCSLARCAPTLPPPRRPPWWTGCWRSA